MVDWGASFKLWKIFSSSENTVLVRLRARAVAASTQTSYGMVRGWHESKNIVKVPMRAIVEDRI